MNLTNENTDTREIESIDISLKHIPFLSIESNLSINALYKILIKNPTLINMINEKKETFLSYAIKRNNNQIIDLLLTSPILDLSYQDKNGNTYLHLSIIHQNLNLIKKLLEKKIYINAKNNDGNTALHFAYYINNIEIINILLNNKADINITNNEGHIPEEIIPTNDIDKIAGYEYHMNFDINIYDELKYIQNNINEDNNIKYNLNLNNYEIDNNDTKPLEKKEIQSKICQLKNNNKINHNRIKDNKSIIINDKNGIINNKNRNNDQKTPVKNNVFNNDNNTSNSKDNNKNNSSNKKLNEDYKDLMTSPFHFGKAKRKISNIDKIYNENDRFFRKESDNYPLYAELINSNNENSNTSLKNNKNKITKLSNIFENNNISENSNDNIIFDKDIKKDNSSLLINNSSSYNSSKNNKNVILRNSNKNNITNNSNNNITIMQNIMINCSNKPLLDFLMQINLQKYYYNLNNNGFDNINMIIENAKQGKYLTDNQLKNIGIIKAGDRAKILIRIQEKANLFEYNIPKVIYYICYNLDKIEDDINVYKLYEWLKNIKLEEFLSNYLNNGYFSVDLLFVQLLSNNPLTDEILKNDLGIDKLGYRTRILNKIKEELNSYLNKLKNSVVSFHTIENNKICNECIFC